jgi:16S rRNA (guanine(966)-N(2))-methyltransferase RsmD
MRVISGIYKGRNIYPPKNFNSRPTTDFAKESLFNILKNYINLNEIDVLDLFSGTGNITYEFLSGGCNRITCVEADRNNVIHLKKLFSSPEFKSKVTISSGDSLKFLKSENLNYDIIFADPPFDYLFFDQIPLTVMNNETLKKFALLIVEHSSKTDLSKIKHFFRSVKYGNVHFSFFRNDE